MKQLSLFICIENIKSFKLIGRGVDDLKTSRIYFFRSSDSLPCELIRLLDVMIVTLFNSDIHVCGVYNMYMHTIRSENGELWLVNSPFTPRKTGSCIVSEKYNRDRLKFSLRYLSPCALPRLKIFLSIITRSGINEPVREISTVDREKCRGGGGVSSSS